MKISLTNLSTAFEKVRAFPGISVNNPFLHCEARTHLILQDPIWHHKNWPEDVSLKKAWIIAEEGQKLHYPSKKAPGHPHYHVAPAITFPDEGSIKCAVFDPVFFKKPVCILAWSRAFGARPEMIKIATPYVSPNNPYGCGYHHSEAFEHIEPRQLAIFAMKCDQATERIEIEKLESNDDFERVALEQTNTSGVWVIAI